MGRNSRPIPPPSEGDKRRNQPTFNVPKPRTPPEDPKPAKK